MRLFFTVVVLACASWVIAQTQAVDTAIQKPMIAPRAPSQGARFRKGPSPGMAPVNAKTANVPPTTPVVRLKGVCKDRPAKSACETVVTREDFDNYASLYAPDLAPAARGRVAVQYAGTLAFAALAEQQGLEKNVALAKEIELQLKLVRKRILANAYLQTLQKQTVGEAEIQQYYEEHKAQYEQIQVRRLSVPFLVPTEDGRPLDRSKVKAEMDELRKRAVAGEDLDALQQDAYKHLHVQAAPPTVNVLTVQRYSVQGDEAKALELKPGEISEVLDLPASFAVLKIESKDPVPLQSVHQQIEATLRGNRVKGEVNKLGSKISAEFNLQYLEMPAQPELFALTAINPVVSRGGVGRRPAAARP